MDYKIIRSRRKTLGLEVTVQGIVVRAPFEVADQDIDRFVRQHRGWIEKTQKKLEEKKDHSEVGEHLSIEDLKALADQAMKVIPQRVEFYASQIGVSYGKITIRNQRTRWGSCSAKGNLNFNCLLMLTPPEVLDSVVVHELCHRKEMNHSKRFYAQVLRVYPQYWTWRQWLKDHGDALIQRMISY